MIVAEFRPYNANVSFTPVSAEILVECAANLLENSKTKDAFLYAGIYLDFKDVDETRINSLILDYVSTNGLLDAFNDNFAISVALARQVAVNNFELNSSAALAFCEDRISYRKKWAEDLSKYRVLPTIPDLMVVANDAYQRSDLLAILDVPANLPQYDILSDQYDPEYVPEVAKFPPHVNKGTREQWPSYAYYLYDKSQFKFGLVNRCQQMNDFIATILFNYHDKQFDEEVFSESPLRSVAYYMSFVETNQIKVRESGKT